MLKTIIGIAVGGVIGRQCGYYKTNYNAHKSCDRIMEIYPEIYSSIDACLEDHMKYISIMSEYGENLGMVLGGIIGYSLE